MSSGTLCPGELCKAWQTGDTSHLSAGSFPANPPPAEHRLLLLTAALGARQRPAHRHALVNPSQPCLLQMWQRESGSESSPAVFLLLSEHHQPKPARKCCEPAAEPNLQSAQHSSVCCHAPGEPFWDQPCFSTSCHCDCFYPLCMFYRQSK